MRILTILITSLFAGFAFSQTATNIPMFEAASIKPNTSLSGHSSSHITNGEVFMRNVSLKGCIQMAYHIAEGRLIGPEWLSTTAVQQQLGLKLEAQKLPIDIIVVDHMERVPTEN